MDVRKRTDLLCDYFEWDKGSEQAMEIEKAIAEAEREAAEHALHKNDAWHENIRQETAKQSKLAGYAEGFRAGQETQCCFDPKSVCNNRKLETEKIFNAAREKAKGIAALYNGESQAQARIAAQRIGEIEP